MALPAPPPEDATAGDVESLMRRSLEFYHKQRYQEAKRLLEDALRRSNELGDRLLSARVLGNLANTCKELHDFDRSVRLYEQALAGFGAVGDSLRTGIILFNAAYTHKLLGRWGDVKRLMEMRLRMPELAAAASLSSAEENRAKAEALLAEADTQIALAKHRGDLAAVRDKLSRGVSLAASRHNAEALLCLAVAHADAETSGFTELQARALTHIANVHARQGQKETALEELNRAAALHRSGEDRAGEQDTLGELAALLIATQQPKQAIAVLEQKIALTKDAGVRARLVTRITSMRARLSRESEGSSGVQLVLPAAASFIESVGNTFRTDLEMKLQRAELDAKRERELMQLCFKDIPFADVTARADQACQTLDQLIPLLRTVAEGEDQCGKVLRAGIQSGIAQSFFGGGTTKADFREPGTAGRALVRLRDSVRTAAEDRRRLAGQMQDDVVIPLSEHKTSLQTAVKRLVQRASKARATLQKAAKRVEVAEQQQAKMQESVAKLRAQLGGVSGDGGGGEQMTAPASVSSSSAAASATAEAGVGEGGASGDGGGATTTIIGTMGHIVSSSSDAKFQAKIVSKLGKLLETREDVLDNLKRRRQELAVAQRMHDAEIAGIADDYQRAEVMRLEILKQNLLDAAKFQLLANQRRQRQLLNMIDEVESIDPTSDVRLYAHNKRVAELLKRPVAEGGSAVGSSNDRLVNALGVSTGPMLPAHAESRDLMSAAIREMFAESSAVAETMRKRRQASGEGEKEEGTLDDAGAIRTAADVKDDVVSHLHGSIKSLEDVALRLEEFKRLFEDEKNRTMFVKLLNLQRSKVQDVGSGYDVLASLMQLNLDWCAKQSDVRTAKMVMIMSETFFRRRTTHPFDQRAEAREYLQSHIKSHPIWHNPHFWEEAFFMSCREEVVKHMAQAGGNSGVGQGFKHVYSNICFGQMGSYALNMVNFGVSIKMTRGFITRMCDVNGIDAVQREMLLENANGLHASAMVAKDAVGAAGGVAPAAAAAPGPRFSSPTNSGGIRSASSSVVSESGEDVF
jgi:tetratricopeptide (TPR) repeat protein